MRVRRSWAQRGRQAVMKCLPVESRILLAACRNSERPTSCWAILVPFRVFFQNTARGGGNGARRAERREHAVRAELDHALEVAERALALEAGAAGEVELQYMRVACEGRGVAGA